MSKYTELLQQGIKRVEELTRQYEECVEKGAHGLAAITKGELSAARSWLEGATMAGEAKREDQR